MSAVWDLYATYGRLATITIPRINRLASWGREYFPAKDKSMQLDKEGADLILSVEEEDADLLHNKIRRFCAAVRSLERLLSECGG